MVIAKKLAELEENDDQPIKFGPPKKRLTSFLPGASLIGALVDQLNLELSTNGQVLWLFKP